MDGNNSDTIPTNLRLLLVLEEVARVGVPVTPTVVNAELGLPKPTINLMGVLLDMKKIQPCESQGCIFTDYWIVVCINGLVICVGY